ncbi:MAG: hypothetical protein Q9184_007600 [Pyrenodesmia sp. 2 TL-2023]
MRFSSFLATALPVLSTLATPPPIPSILATQSSHLGTSSEYYSLGCPNTTKPVASQQEQLQAITNFENLLVQKQFATAYNTYAAADIINHAARIPGNGTALAISYLVPTLATTNLTLLDVWVGLNAQNVTKSTAYLKGNSAVRGLGVIVDIRRMIGTCLVEAWEVGAPVTNSTNPIAYF